MENKLEKLYKRIHILCVLSILLNIIMLVGCVLVSFSDIRTFPILFYVVVSFYIIMQIDDGAGKMQLDPSNYLIPIHYCKRVSYACFVSAIGGSIINSIVISISKKELHLACNLTTMVVGILLYIGAKVYQYGCEQKVEMEVVE